MHNAIIRNNVTTVWMTSKEIKIKNDLLQSSNVIANLASYIMYWNSFLIYFYHRIYKLNS